MPFLEPTEDIENDLLSERGIKMTKTLIHDEKAHLMVVSRAVSVSVGTGSVSVSVGVVAQRAAVAAVVAVATGGVAAVAAVAVSGTTVSTVVGRGGAVSGVSVSLSASRDNSHQGSQTQQLQRRKHSSGRIVQVSFFARM